MLFIGDECTGSGTVTGPARSRTTPNGAQVASFSVRVYGLPDQKYADVECWKDLVPYACALEKGDVVHIDGNVRKDDYQSQKKGTTQYKIVANFLQAQQTVNAPDDGGYDEYAGSEWESMASDGYDPFPD